MKNKISIKIVFLVIGVAVLTSLLTFVFFEKQKAKSKNVIKVSGNIEGDEVRISFRVEGKIIVLLTDEGEFIEFGQSVALLDTDELIRIRDERKAALERARYEHKLAYDDYIRAVNLFEVGAISAQRMDEAKTKMDATKAGVEELVASLELAETRLGFTDLQAPLNGFVLVKTALAGEVVQIGAPVFTAIDLDDIWVTAYLNEMDVGKVNLNQPAYIKIDSYPDKKYRGWVSYISKEAEFTPKFIQTTEERVKLVYRIKVRADNSSLELKPGMPADAYILLNQ